MTQTTTTDSSSTATAMGNGNKKMTVNSFSADDLRKFTSRAPNKPVSSWTSSEVQNWIKEQCKNFELKKNTADKFEMNGQALMLLTKHDFIRRSPNGGEVLYYSLQRLINPNRTINSISRDQSSLSNGLSGQQPQIIEINGDYDEINGTGNSSSQPIIEEPDDPPKIRRSQSDTNRSTTQQQNNHRFPYNQALNQAVVVTVPVDTAAAYLHHQHMYTQPQLHMHPQQFYYPHVFQQYHPMMTARGILIEIIDDPDPSAYASAGISPTTNGVQEPLFMVTVNGQRYIMNETQAKQLVIDVYQREAYQQNLQQQQLFQQQQQFFQQQQLYAQQQQQYAQQQQQLFQQQQQQQQQQQPPPPPPSQQQQQQQRKQQQRL